MKENPGIISVLEDETPGYIPKQSECSNLRFFLVDPGLLFIITGINVPERALFYEIFMKEDIGFIFPYFPLVHAEKGGLTPGDQECIDSHLTAGGRAAKNPIYSCGNNFAFILPEDSYNKE